MILSELVKRPPSLVILTIFGIPVMVDLMKVSDSSVSVPLTSSEVTKVPVIVSYLK